MKIFLAFVLALLIGGACRCAGVPLPAPTALVGALLVLAMSTGYVLTGRLLGPCAPAARRRESATGNRAGTGTP